MGNKNQLVRRTLVAGICSALLLLFWLAASRASHESLAKSTASLRSATEESPKFPARATQPFVVSNSSSAAELGRSINRLIDEGKFATARWGVFVLSLRDGRVLFARNADRAFAPASNLKLYTTAVALDLLGSDYRWRTSVYAETNPEKNGAIAGDLALYGRGAPDLFSRAGPDDPQPSLDQLADELYKRGVRRVRGGIIGDESYFRGEPLGDGWLWNDVQWYFGAEVSALSINDNAINATVTPASNLNEAASIKLKPETSYMRIENDTTTRERGTPATLGITRGLSDNNVRVWGDFPVGGRAVSARLSVHRPALWAALLFQEALRRRGIAVDGKARSADARENGGERIDHARGVQLASVPSKTLGQIVRMTNKESINLYAELILRTLGKERGGTATVPDPNKMKTRGDDEAGVAVIRQWLEGRGVAVGALALHDGSGLSRLNLVTPEATARLLAVMLQTPSAGVFRDSLPVAGRDGTLKFRLRSVDSGRIAAKTGTLTYISSLSGYATTADEELLAFSIICNDEGDEGLSSRTIDAIAALFTSYSESGP